MSKDNIGFLTIAQNNSQTNYLELALVQAYNLKYLHPDFKYAVIVDDDTKKLVNQEHEKVFDYIIDLPIDKTPQGIDWKLANEHQIFRLTPFKETIKVEADLLMTRSIKHWLHAFRLRDIVLSYGCLTLTQTEAKSRANRKFFDDNNLPDIYSGLMYFRYSQMANLFFIKATEIFHNWDLIKNNLKNCKDSTPSTDVLFALTAKLIGVEMCTLPTLDFIKFVHMKSNIHNGGSSDRWQDMFLHEIDGTMIRVANFNQYSPFHYHEKDFITDDVKHLYKELYDSR